MSVTYKAAVIGSTDVVMGFKALGLDTFAVSDAAQARRTLRKLSHGDASRGEQQYAVIYLEESLAGALHDEIEELRNKTVPAVILIPGRGGETGYGAESLRQAVIRAVGADIMNS